MGQKMRSIQAIPRAMAMLIACCAGNAQLAAGDSLEFRPQRVTTVRLANQTSTKGKLKSISEDKVVVILNDDTEREIPMTSVRLITSNDGRFKYAPAQETFQDLVTRAGKIQGVTIAKAASAGNSASNMAAGSSATPVKGGPNAPPRIFAALAGLDGQSGSRSDALAINHGFAGPNRKPDAPPPLNLAAVASIGGGVGMPVPKSVGASIPKPLGNGAAGVRSGDSHEILICSNPACRKEVAGAQYGEKCPHCGTIWLAESAGEMLATAGPVPGNGPGAENRNPFGAGKSQGDPVTGGGVANKAVASGGTKAISGGFSIETLPWWGKAGAFAGLLVVLWLISQRR